MVPVIGHVINVDTSTGEEIPRRLGSGGAIPVEETALRSFPRRTSSVRCAGSSRMRELPADVSVFSGDHSLVRQSEVDLV